MMHQDSSHPTGVAAVRDRDHTSGNAAANARTRKSLAAVDLALGNYSWAEIAQALGYPTPRAAKQAVESALRKHLLTDVDKEKLRKYAGAKLDRLLQGVWLKAIDPDHPEQMAAFDRARQAIADHRKLFGYDVPSEVVVHNPTMMEIEAWVAGRLADQIPQVTEYDILATHENEDGTYVVSDPRT